MNAASAAESNSNSNTYVNQLSNRLPVDSDNTITVTATAMGTFGTFITKQLDAVCYAASIQFPVHINTQNINFQDYFGISNRC